MFTVVCPLGLTLLQKLLEELDSSVVWSKISTAGVFPVSSTLDPLQADFHPSHSNKTVITRATDDIFLANPLFSSTWASVCVTFTSCLRFHEPLLQHFFPGDALHIEKMKGPSHW